MLQHDELCPRILHGQHLYCSIIAYVTLQMARSIACTLTDLAKAALNMQSMKSLNRFFPGLLCLECFACVTYITYSTHCSEIYCVL